MLFNFDKFLIYFGYNNIYRLKQKKYQTKKLKILIFIIWIALLLLF